MITFKNGGRLVQSVDELPHLEGAHYLYVDFETTSGSKKLKSLNPWHNCSIAGIAVTANEIGEAWYVPIGHNDEHWNLPKEPVLQWLRDMIKSADHWVNQNVKYDALVGAQVGVEFNSLICTMTLAKIIDSDKIMRGGYSLVALSRDWLGRDISHYEKRVKAFLLGCGKSQDYGDVPADMLGEYACEDALTARRLFKYEDEKCPTECRGVWDTEIKLTPVLFDMEMEGLHIDSLECQKQKLVTMTKMLSIEESIDNFTGLAIRPHVNDDCYDLLCNKYGLPVLGWTDESNPSFDKDTLKSYKRHPRVLADENLLQVVDLMLEYRKMNTLLSLFINTFLRLHVDGVLHPTYNQAIRTGRMSCSMPNAQQQSKASKALIHPAPGCSFLSMDYSQIEFRIIVHYIQDAACIEAYRLNPDIDFHAWVAEMCSITRDPAKNVNFAMGFGGGKRRILSMLASNMELVGALMEQVKAETDDPDMQETLFLALARRRAETVYNTYHNTLPGLKRTSYRASNRLKQRGHVRNAYGRYRHLPEEFAFRAFNSIVQSSAADVQKERTVATAPRYNSDVRALEITQVANVHDETLFHGPSESIEDPRTRALITTIMEDVAVDFRVPIRVAAGLSNTSWAIASGDDGKVSVERSLACRDRLSRYP